MRNPEEDDFLELPKPIHIVVPGVPDDPRAAEPPPDGLVIHYSPTLHPDDLTVVRGIPCTAVPRTLIDCAEELGKDELRGCFARAIVKGLLDPDELAAARARVEWRPSLVMLDELIAEFYPDLTW